MAKIRNAQRSRPGLLSIFFLGLAFYLFSAFSLPKIKVPFVKASPKTQEESSAKPAPEVTRYTQLLYEIRKARAVSEKRVETAVEQEKVREAWEIGKLIDEHVLQHQRADYDQEVLLRLSKDLEMSDTELGYMLQFARTYAISPPAGKLSWAHYRELLSLNDAKEREQMAKKAVAGKWSREQVREEVKKHKIQKGEAKEKPGPALAPLTPGKLRTFKVVRSMAGKDRGELVLDLGFANTFLPARELPYMDDTVVEFIPASGEEGSRLAPVRNAGPQDLNNYEAAVVEIIDGDTLWAKVDLGFGISTFQRLRLNHIDAPEILTAEGKEAKKFLEKLLEDASKGKSPASQGESAILPTHDGQPSVVIHAGKLDNHGRYLIELFINGEYVNQKLLDEGLAVVMKD